MKGNSEQNTKPLWHRFTNLWSAVAIILAITAICITIFRGTSTAVDNSASNNLPSGFSAVSSSVLEEADSLLLFNEKWVEGLYVDSLDLEDVDEVFSHIYSKLPEEVHVYPSENYYYFKLYIDKRQIWGNIRLPANIRDDGILSFAYFEFKESQYVTEPRIKLSKFYSAADGVVVQEVDPFKWSVEYKGKEVIFNLHQLSQEPPKLFDLGEDEIFIMRTFDESGYQWFLLFNEERNYLFWVLNEEEYIPDYLEPLADDLVVGRRSGFAFYVDFEHNYRKVLAAILGDNATVNNYYDGPFDQLADNYVDDTNIAEYLQLAIPTLEGRIDKFGYYLDKDGSSRVAVSPYYVYFSSIDLQLYMDRLRESEDPFQLISQRGRTSDSSS